MFRCRPPGFHTTIREPKRAHFMAPASKHQNSTRRPPRERRKNEISCGRGKKERNFGRSRGRAVRRRGGPGERPKNLEHTHHTHKQGTTNRHHQQAPTGNNKQEQTTKTMTTTTENLAKKLTLKLAKGGLAKCGHENKLAKFGFKRLRPFIGRRMVGVAAAFGQTCFGNPHLAALAKTTFGQHHIWPKNPNLAILFS